MRDRLIENYGELQKKWSSKIRSCKEQSMKIASQTEDNKSKRSHKLWKITISSNNLSRLIQPLLIVAYHIIQVKDTTTVTSISQELNKMFTVKMKEIELRLLKDQRDLVLQQEIILKQVEQVIHTLGKKVIMFIRGSIHPSYQAAIVNMRMRISQTQQSNTIFLLLFSKTNSNFTLQ